MPPWQSAPPVGPISHGAAAAARVHPTILRVEPAVKLPVPERDPDVIVVRLHLGKDLHVPIMQWVYMGCIWGVYGVFRGVLGCIWGVYGVFRYVRGYIWCIFMYNGCI